MHAASGQCARQRAVRTVALLCCAQQVWCIRMWACSSIVHRRAMDKRTASIVSVAASMTTPGQLRAG
ncbi:hypothetical protein XAXN_05255 [Xanthomonas axonopodis]|uniref:Uncharacterized protein n=1 Tax=Xanthomonas axonopodis TaxID=53413 RepID=A0A0P6VD45_9XANT|nr:hypothetical protein XAXN_05255 [Xanthomonas axonopodis]